MSYATRDDVYQLALSAQAFVSRARTLDAVDIFTGIIKCKAHGLTSDDIVTIDVASGAVVPTGVSTTVAYSVEPVSSDLFRLVDPATSLPITSFDQSGKGWGIAIDPARRIDAHLVETAARIDEHLTAEEPPIKTDPNTGLYPAVLVGLNARMAARQAVASLQVENPAYRVAVDRLEAQKDADEAMLQKWLQGKPINVRPLDQGSEPENGARASSSYSASGWTSGVL